MSESNMVVATKYLLTSPISIKHGTWDKKGAKVKVHTKIISRDYVEQRNSHDNNELYVIDEEATAEMLKERAENIIKNAEAAKKEKMSTADLVDAIKGANTASTPKQPKKVEAKKITHKLTKTDIENNPGLSENGLKAGDEVELDKEGNVIFKS